MDPSDPSATCLQSGFTNLQIHLRDLYGGPGGVQFYSRETTVWNFGSPFFAHDALSREATVFNFGQPTADLEAISREVTVLNFEEPTIP